MKITALVIAHNEERYIARCLESLLAQSRRPDEIVVVNHRSADRTGDIARTYPARVIDYDGPAGAAHARIRGLEDAIGDIVLCIDGDSEAAKNWIEVMAAELTHPQYALVGSWIRITGAFYFFLGTWYWRFVCARPGRGADYLWGASFGLRGEDRSLAISALERGISLSKELKLAYVPDDYWLALFFMQKGEVKITNRTWVTARAKEKSSIEGIRRGLVARRIRRTVEGYLGRHDLPRLAFVQRQG